MFNELDLQTLIRTGCSIFLAFNKIKLDALCNAMFSEFDLKAIQWNVWFSLSVPYIWPWAKLN